MAEADELIDEIFSQFLSEPPSPAASAATGGNRDDESDDANDPTISISHLSDIITALELDATYGAVAAPTKHAAIKKALDPTACGRVRRQTFREIVPFLLEESVADGHESVSEDPTAANDNNSSTFDVTRANKSSSRNQVSRESVYQDFLLFTEGQDRPIVLADLKRVSAELKDNAPVELLTNMMQLKPPSGSGGGNSDPHSISFVEFEYIMRMAKSI
ncbi:hypothetical protein D0Z00_003049 [Geotrichum galactomycetum]|uniref:Uncharacterized protein n=1 Tax=Geotrichum galactomycetum TaxID=27317 RepID=A0ACB6V2H7_9ASCO|nr:hypothetical protein D0Z00_003049 [Geotrichum candidum]